MLTFRKYDWEDKECDSCGNITMAVLEINNITIPLCADCIKDLTDQLNAYNNTIFCYKCPDFVMNKWGWRYGGSCKKKAAQDGTVITKDNAGYYCCVDCLNTCKDAR